jgi:tetratricopeptide (TPR) repeat protein
VYQAWEKYDLAINYYTHALEHARLTNNSNTEAIRLSNLGMAYYGKGDFTKAMELLLQAKSIDEKAGREFKVAIRKNELSKILAAQGDFNQAIAYSEEALNFFNKANVHKSRAYVYIDLGHYYQGIHNYLKSEQSYLTSMAIAELLKSDYLLMLTYKGYSALLEQWNKPKEALEYFKKYESVNNRIFNAEKHKQLANFEIKFLTREKEMENELLKRENQEKKNRLILLSVGIISLLLISILIILGIRLKNQTLRQQKELAERELKENEIEKLHLEDKVFAEKHINRLQQEQYTQNIEHKNQMLANSTLGLIQKNEFLIDLKSKIAENGEENGMSKKDIIRLINQNIDLNQDWNKFSMEFSEIHPGFFDKLKSDYPDLTESFIQLCAYLSIDLTSKEIAQLQHISISAVNKNRQRLRKKLQLEPEADLSNFLKNIT